MNTATLSERIRHARKSKGLNQAELAEQLGMSEMTVRRWETEKSSPRMEEIQKIAQVLNIPPEELLHGYTSENVKPETDTDQETKLIYEWGGNHRVVLPNTPETRELFREIMLSAIPRDAAPAATA